MLPPKMGPSSLALSAPDKEHKEKGLLPAALVIIPPEESRNNGSCDSFLKGGCAPIPFLVIPLLSPAGWVLMQGAGLLFL